MHRTNLRDQFWQRIKALFESEIIHLKVILVALFVLVVTGVICWWVAERGNLLPINQEPEDVASLLNTLWQVQASVVTLSIAILTILTGISKEEIMGMRVLQYISIRRNSFGIRFNTWDETVISILSVFFMYFFTAYMLIGGALFIFLVNIIIILHMLYKMLSMLVFPEKTTNEIIFYMEQYALEQVRLENEYGTR